MRVGVCYESIAKNPADPAVWRDLSAMHIDHVRYWGMADLINPSPGVFDLDRVKTDVDNMRAAGLSVYYQNLWLPNHATNGIPFHREGINGLWIKQPDGGLHIAGTCVQRAENAGQLCPICKANPQKVDWVLNPPHVDPAVPRAIGFAVGSALRDKVMVYSGWNEWAVDLYNPLIFLANTGRMTRAEAIRRPMEEIVIPFMEGVRQGDPNAKFIGPEAAAFGDLEEALMQEIAHGGKLYDDAVSVHPYGDWIAGSDPVNSLYRIDREFLDPFSRFAKGRKLWLSEYHGANLTQWLRCVDTLFDDRVVGVTLYVPAESFPRSSEGQRIKADLESDKRRAVLHA